jgi:hypothetical protein
MIFDAAAGKFTCYGTVELSASSNRWICKNWSTSSFDDGGGGIRLLYSSM